MDFNESQSSTDYPRARLRIDRKSLQENPRKSIADAKKSAAALFALGQSESASSLARRRLSAKRTSATKIPAVRSIVINDGMVKIEEGDEDATEVNEEVEAKKEVPSFLLSVRFLLAVLAFFAYAVQYTQKTDISVAIVCMINNTALKEMSHSVVNENSATTNQVDDKCYFKAAESHAKDGEFVWAKDTQGLLLSVYFIGYAITEIPGGMLALKFGSKIVIDVAILIGSIFTLLIPSLTRLHWGALLACRLITGAAHGTLWPAFSGFWASWAPPSERSRLIGIANAGSQIGNVIALPLGGFLCDNGFDDGWGSIFYIFGAFGIGWFVLWTIFSSNSPEYNKFISKKEKDYILEETKEIVEAHHKGHNEAPWLDIFKSKACWAIFIGHTCSNWGTYLFLTQLPTYMKEILRFDIHSNGLFSALPYIIFWFTIIFAGIMADQLMIRFKISKTIVRKIFNSCGFAIPMGAVIGLSFVDCSSPYIGVVLLCIAMAATGFCYGAGFLVNYNDISGPYSGIVFGIGNTFATIPGIIAPYLVGVLTPNRSQEEWRIVFIITAVVYAVGGVISFLFTHSTVQYWAILHEIEIIDEPEEPRIVPDEKIIELYRRFEATNDENQLLEAFRHIRYLRLLEDSVPIASSKLV